MKKVVQLSGIIILIFTFSASVHSEGQYEDSMKMEFTEPSKPGRVEVTSGRGNITINGYDGREVIIRTKSDIENMVNPPEDEKAKGLKRISGTNFYVDLNKEENAIVISRPLKDEIELFIQVPFNTSLKIGGDNFLMPGTQISTGTSLKIKSNNDVISEVAPRQFFAVSGRILEGNVDINNISGQIEINTIKGNISLLGISGAVTVNATQGDILAIFESIDQEKPLYFSTVSGDIDVTFPSNIKTDLTLSSVDGNMYTDFDINIVKRSRTPTIQMMDTTNYTGSSLTLPDIGFGKNTITGTINGGDLEVQMKTVNGNIYIRKGK